MLHIKPTLLALMLLSACSQAFQTQYVAMGDDFASGAGAGNYDDGSGSCKRSTKSYPTLWSNVNKPANFQFAACSGATTRDVIRDQLGRATGSTSLISLTVGANDVRLFQALVTCGQESEALCVSATQQSNSEINRVLAYNLDALYNAIKSKSSSAKVVVLGYPRMYSIPDSYADTTETARDAINKLIDALNVVIADRAEEHGFVFGDVRDNFAGHEVCSSAAWLNAITSPIDESHHPTAIGHESGYLPVLNREN